MALLIANTGIVAGSADGEMTLTRKEKKVFSDSGVVVSTTEALAQADSVSVQAVSSGESLPEKYSSVEKGYVTYIRNQSSHNTCWIYSSMATLETALLKKGYGNYDLSEEHLDIWATQRDNGTGWTRTLNSGSLFDTATGYLVSWQGPRLESQIPYDYAKGRTFEQIDAIGTTEYGVTDIVLLPNNRNAIKQAVREYGAVSANFSANSIFFNSEKTAVYAYMTFSSNSQVQGHAVSVVGWDDNYAKENFRTDCTPKHDGAWLCKNSWGSSYNSIGGYLWISYDDPYLFSDILSTPFAVRDVMKIDSNIHMYQAENYGSTYDFNISRTQADGTAENIENITFINKLDFTDRYGHLEKVLFETQAVGAKYTVYYIPLNGGGVPTSLEKNWVKLAEGTVDYSGYRSVAVNYELPYGKGAVGVRIDGTSDGLQSMLGCDEWLSNSSGKMLFIPDAKKDVSYLKYDGSMYELLDFYKTNFDDDIGSNFVIKAVAESDDGIEKYDVNDDGEISLIDIVFAQQYLLGVRNFSRNECYSADIDINGKVSLADVVKIQRKIIDLE